MANKGKGSKSKSYLVNLDFEALQEMCSEDKVYNYKELCKKLNIPYFSGGTSKEKELKELAMICEYEKHNTKYKFFKIRNDDEIVLFNERSIYAPLIESIITKTFIEKETQEKLVNGLLYVSVPDILIMTGMVNENFKEIRNSNHMGIVAVTLANKFKFSTGDLKMFVNVSYRDVLKPIVRDALKSMDNKGCITIHPAYKVRDGKSTKAILGSSDEGKLLDKIVGNTLNEFKIKNKFQLYMKPKNEREQFYKTCDDKCKELLGYDGFYDCYAIHVINNRVRVTLEALKRELNMRIQTRIINAKQLNNLSVNSKNNMIDAMIKLDTDYDFKRDKANHFRVINGGLWNEKD